MKTAIALFLTLGAASNAVGDSFDPATNQLTIPQITISGTNYSNMVVTVGKVLSVNTGTPGLTDSYSPDTRILTIPGISVAGRVYTNVRLQVDSIQSMNRNIVSGQRTSTVSGSVVDRNGQPIADAVVSVFHHNDHVTLTATTDANGYWSLSGLTTSNNADYAIYIGKPGFGFTPSSNDAAGAVTKFDFNGWYRTVVRFAAMPARDVGGINFTALRTGDKLVSLPRTGQTISYHSGDDVAANKGVTWPTQRFIDNLDGTVTDNLTGLIWTKNAGCFAPGNWYDALATANQLASGSCGLADGSSAGDWRMPNANELESLVDVSQANPAVAAGSPFTNINTGTAYWSSTPYIFSNAMAIRLSDGRWINGEYGTYNNNPRSTANALWAVKSGGTGAIQLLATGVYNGIGGVTLAAGDDATLQKGVRLPFPRFIDNGDGTLSDTATGLVWLKQANCIQQSWSAAIDSINKLASGQCGLTDGSSAGQWRMPNRSEMLSLSDRAPTFSQAAYFDGIPGTNGVVVPGSVTFNGFVGSYYWTSTTDAADPASAWTVYACDFGVYDMLKSETGIYALAVR